MKHLRNVKSKIFKRTNNNDRDSNDDSPVDTDAHQRAAQYYNSEETTTGGSASQTSLDTAPVARAQAAAPEVDTQGGERFNFRAAALRSTRSLANIKPSGTIPDFTSLTSRFKKSAAPTNSPAAQNTSNFLQTPSRQPPVDIVQNSSDQLQEKKNMYGKGRWAPPPHMRGERPGLPNPLGAHTPNQNDKEPDHERPHPGQEEVQEAYQEAQNDARSERAVTVSDSDSLRSYHDSESPVGSSSASIKSSVSKSPENTEENVSNYSASLKSYDTGATENFTTRLEPTNTTPSDNPQQTIERVTSRSSSVRTVIPRSSSQPNMGAIGEGRNKSQESLGTNGPSFLKSLLSRTTSRASSTKSSREGSIGKSSLSNVQTADDHPSTTGNTTHAQASKDNASMTTTTTSTSTLSKGSKAHKLMGISAPLDTAEVEEGVGENTGDELPIRSSSRMALESPISTVETEEANCVEFNLGCAWLRSQDPEHINSLWTTVATDCAHLVVKMSAPPSLALGKIAAGDFLLRGLMNVRGLTKLTITGLANQAKAFHQKADNWQQAIWVAALLNPGLESLEIGVETPISLNKDAGLQWPKVNHGWTVARGPSAFPGYLGKMGDGKLGEELGEGEFVDGAAFQAARVLVKRILGRKAPKKLALRELVLRGMVVCAGEVSACCEVEELEVIHLGQGCVDAGLRDLAGHVEMRYSP